MLDKVLEETLNFIQRNLVGTLIKMAAENLSTPKNTTKRSCSASASLTNFSDENVHKPGFLKCISDIDLKNSIVEFLIITFYGNGNNEENKGFVSVNFRCNMPLIFKSHHCFNFSCVIAIKDVHGAKRFSRTFTFAYDPEAQSRQLSTLTEFTVGRYIARQIVLDDKDLRHDDCLKLEVEAYFESVVEDNLTEIEDVFNSSVGVLKYEDESKSVILLLDSVVAVCLYEVSSMFRALCDTPMIENIRGFVSLDNEDFSSFKKAVYIILGAKAITFRNMDKIEDLYIFADKWDIQDVICACHKFFTEVLNVKSAWGTFSSLTKRINKISALATSFSDDILRVTVNKFLKDEHKLNTDEEHERDSDEKYDCPVSKVDFGNLKMEFSGSSPYLYFVIEKEEDDFNFDFYH